MPGAKARINLKIRAGAKRTEFAGKLGDVWKLHVAAPPVDGKANVALMKFLAELVHRPVSAVRIVRGFTSPVKTVRLTGSIPKAWIALFSNRMDLKRIQESL